MIHTQYVSFVIASSGFCSTVTSLVAASSTTIRDPSSMLPSAASAVAVSIACARFSMIDGLLGLQWWESIARCKRGTAEGKIRCGKEVSLSWHSDCAATVYCAIYGRPGFCRTLTLKWHEPSQAEQKLGGDAQLVVRKQIGLTRVSTRVHETDGRNQAVPGWHKRAGVTGRSHVLVSCRTIPRDLVWMIRK